MNTEHSLFYRVDYGMCVWKGEEASYWCGSHLRRGDGDADRCIRVVLHDGSLSSGFPDVTEMRSTTTKAEASNDAPVRPIFPVPSAAAGSTRAIKHTCGILTSMFTLLLLLLPDDMAPELLPAGCCCCCCCRSWEAPSSSSSERAPRTQAVPLICLSSISWLAQRVTGRALKFTLVCEVALALGPSVNLSPSVVVTVDSSKLRAGLDPGFLWNTRGTQTTSGYRRHRNRNKGTFHIQLFISHIHTSYICPMIPCVHTPCNSTSQDRQSVERRDAGIGATAEGPLRRVRKLGSRHF